jgi:glycosyltransferase involved in cell wall biosynthesis
MFKVDNDKLKVMLVTEGTYPFHHGGVSTWSDILINNLKDNMDFVVYSIIMNPYVTQKFNLGSKTELIKVPLWGTEEASEHLDIPFSKVYMAKKRTTDNVIEREFIPMFLDLVSELVSENKDESKFSVTLHNLYKYFQVYEYKKSFKSEITWTAYKNFIIEFTRDKSNDLEHPGVYSIIQSLGWIYRFMTILNTPVPKVDVTHSAAAAFCGIPCVLAKMEYNTPFLLTEHGVYLREQYLSRMQRGYPSFLNTFLIRMIHSVVNLNYAFADQVSPVCGYNTRWERRFGVDKEKIQVIYNGVDKDVFAPSLKTEKNKYPTVVSIARVDPAKDIITLMKAAQIVKKEIPDVRFVIYGSITVPEYYEECLKMKEEMKLGDTFIFAGHTANVAEAYQSGDVVALSSITEAFPYSVVEAMMVGKPVISTDVGGIGEAIGDCGILVEPRHAEGFAEGLITLLKNPNLRTNLGIDARNRALNFFTKKNVRDLYFKSYLKLAMDANRIIRVEEVAVVPISALSKNRQKLFMDRGYALYEIGYYSEAIAEFRKAEQELPTSPAVPVILTIISEIYRNMGEIDKANIELRKAEAISGI